MKTLIAIAALLAPALVVPAAQAQQTALETTVSYADLDLSHDSGRAALHRRVEMAVARVCPQRPMPPELTQMRIYRACRAQAWASANAQLARIGSGRAYAQAQITVAGRGE